jgi:glutamine synthetase
MTPESPGNGLVSVPPTLEAKRITLMLGQAEYLWLDGAHPTQQLRSKTRIVDLPESPVAPDDFPQWSYDGSSTYQSDGGDSDLILDPARVVRDPLRGEGNYLVLCEVMKGDGSPHASNARARLRARLDGGAAEHEPWIGFEQEYTLIARGRPLGFPDNGFPGPQGPYYCSIGADRAFGRELVEAHTRACIEAGIMIYGVNAEVMPGQWEFQIGYRGIEGESADPLTAADHLWIARWILMRQGEDFDVVASFDVKPIMGDWNGAGCHTNFSTGSTRKPQVGLAAIEVAIDRLGARHAAHIAVYGHGLEDRLTGLHETASIDQFLSGVADRGASIRIPRQVYERGFGYLEDRRPGANCDPYRVADALIETVCPTFDNELALAG